MTKRGQCCPIKIQCIKTDDAINDLTKSLKYVHRSLNPSIL